MPVAPRETREDAYLSARRISTFDTERHLFVANLWRPQAELLESRDEIIVDLDEVPTKCFAFE